MQHKCRSFKFSRFFLCLYPGPLGTGAFVAAIMLRPTSGIGSRLFHHAFSRKRLFHGQTAPSIYDKPAARLVQYAESQRIPPEPPTYDNPRSASLATVRLF